jgi:hypothetical protein
MSNDQPVPEGKDPVLWAIAQKRASFKKHLITYLIVNAFLWALWYFTSGHHYFNEGDVNFLRWNHAFPWPIWTSLGWGIGLAFHFAGAYIFPQSSAVENEYEKLNRQKNRQ